MPRLSTRTGFMMTTFAPKEQKYTEDQFNVYTKAYLKILRPVKWSIVSEPCPATPDDWHMHMLCWYGSQKFISETMQRKIKEVTKQLVNVDFSWIKAKGHDSLQSAVNKIQYAMGKSDKQKEKHHVATSGEQDLEALLATYVALCKEAKAVKQSTGADFTNPREMFFVKLRAGQGHIEQYEEAEEAYAREPTTRNFKQMDFLIQKTEELQKYENNYLELRRKIAYKKNYVVPTLRTWQKKAIAIIDSTKPGRRIPVFVDPTGDRGKSFLQEYLERTRDAISFPNAKTSDIACAYKTQKLIMFNYTRSQPVDKINYSVIENLLDGRIFSSKYRSGCRRFEKPLVVMFMNELPWLAKMSLDRWDIYTIKDSNTLKPYEDVGLDRMGFVLPLEALPPFGKKKEHAYTNPWTPYDTNGWG